MIMGNQNQIVQRIKKDDVFRKELASRDLLWFAQIYFKKYLSYKTAPFQKEIYQILQDGSNFNEIIAFRGSAKRQPLDAKILTPSGFRLMGELFVGDYVVGADGKPTKIEYISETIDKDVYLVETEDGRKTECDIEHLWSVRKMSNVKEKYVVLDVEHIIKAGLFYKRIDKRDGRRFNEYKFAIDTVKPVYLEKRDLSLDPYLLGILLGDGSFDKKTGFARLHFHRDDDKHYRKYLSGYDLSETKYDKRNNNVGRFSVRKIGNIIKKLKLNVSVYDKFIPDYYLYGSIEQRKAILEGLMDTDGTVNNCGTPSFCSVSEKLIDGVVSLVRSLGGRATKIRNKYNGFISWRVFILFTDYIPFRLERKRGICNFATHTFSRIVSISKKGNKKGRCIKVSNDDGLYVTDDYLLTHNTTVSMLFYPIWAMVTQRKHHIVLISDTFSQIKDHIYNIKTELENNERLKKDFGPFEVEVETQKKQEWQKASMIIPDYDVKIVGKSTGQKVRGIRYKQYRPDLIVIDDIEDLEMVRTKEQRDKTHRWLTGNVIPAGTKETKYVLIGNLLHSDAIMSRIKKEIEGGLRDGKVVEFPLVDKEGNILWEGKYPDMGAVGVERKQVEAGSLIGMRAWQREFLLKLIPEAGQIIKDEWIKYYDNVPGGVIAKGTGIDLAISKKASAHYTAGVSGKLVVIEESPKIYVMPNPLNERLSGFETTEKAEAISKALGDERNLTSLWVEDVAYQRMQIEAMEKAGLPVSGIKVSTDKRARLITIASYVQNGTVLFPKEGCEDLILQLVGFGVEAYDDLADAFVYMVQGLMNQYAGIPEHLPRDISETGTKPITGSLLKKRF